MLLRNLDSPNDYRHFLDFGQAVLAGQFPYDPAVEARWHPGTWATWPPSFVPVAVLLARLDAAVGQAATIFLWQLANLAGLAAVLAVGVRWLYGRRLSLAPLPGAPASGGPDAARPGGRTPPRPGGPDAARPGGRTPPRPGGPTEPRPGGPGEGRAADRLPSDRLPLWTLPALAGILVPARLLLGNFEHTQANLLMVGLAVAAFALFRRGRRASGGLAFGLASGIKATPLLLLAYLAWRGRWRDLGAAAAGCAVTWGLLPAAVVGPGRVGRWYAAWWERTGALHLPTSGMNQSLQATLTRLMAPDGPLVAQGPGAGGLGGYGAEGWVLGTAAALGLAAAVAFGRPLRRVTARREALELGVVLAAMGLFSPLGWKFHFVGLLLLAAALYAVLPRAAAWRRVSPGRTGEEGGGGAPGTREERAEGGAGPGTLEDGAEGGGGPGTRGERGEGSGLGTLGGGSARAVAAVLVGAAAAVNLTATDLIGGTAADAAERYGVVTWSALALVAAALWALRRARDGEANRGQARGRAASSAPPPSGPPASSEARS